MQVQASSQDNGRAGAESWGIQDYRSDMNELKDEAKLYCKMVMETITKVITSLGTSDMDEKLEAHLVDGIIYFFQEQTMSK